MDNSKLRDELRFFEGEKHEVYLDSLGYKTAGIGHLLKGIEQNLPVGHRISFRQVEEWFNSDVIEAIRVAKEFYEDFDSLTEERQRLLVNLCFQLGNKIHQFKTFKASLLLGRYDLAGNALENSKWYTQSGRRGPMIVAAMRSGIINFS